MNRRSSFWIGLILGGAVWVHGGVAAPDAHGQALPARPVSATPVPAAAATPTAPASDAASPPAAVLAVPVPTPPVTAVPGPVMTATAFPPNSPGAVTISGFIATQLGDLTGINPVAAKAARVALVTACPRVTSTSTTTAAYQTTYAKELASQVKPLLLRTAPLRVRLNLGVALASITSNAPTLVFSPAVQQLMGDPNSAVALWGLKAARPLVATAIVQPGVKESDPLFVSIVKSVQSHAPDSFAGPLAVDAYRALVVNPESVPGMKGDDVRPLLKVLYGPVMDLVVYRTGQYAAGMVPSPEAERDVPLFLSRDYDKMTQAQKDRTVQVLLNLMDAAGQRAVLIPNANRSLLHDVTDLVKRCASALTVMYRVGDATHPPLPTAMPLDKIASLDLSATGAQIAAATATAYPTLSLRFKLVKPTTLPPVAAQAAPLVVPPPVIAQPVARNKPKSRPATPAPGR